MPEPKKKLGLDALKTAMSFVTGPTDVLGVDIGSFSIKVVLLKPEGDGLALKTWGVIPLAVPAELPPEEKNKLAAKLLKDFLHKNGVQRVVAATSVSGTSVIVRYGKFPAMSRADMAKALPTEAEPLIPFDIKEALLSFYILGEVEEDGVKRSDVVLAAAKRDVVQARLDILRGAGLAPQVVDVDAFALENVHEMINPAPEPGGTLYLNIGHMLTNLSIIDSPSVTRVARDVFVAGTGFTKAVQKILQSDAETAEKAKQTHGILVTPEEKEAALLEGDRDALAVSQGLGKVADELLKEVHRSVDYYLSQGAERSISRVVLAGGSANVKNLPHYMAQELKVPVEVLNPLAFLKDKGAQVPELERASLAIATGLALRKVKDWL